MKNFFALVLINSVLWFSSLAVGELVQGKYAGEFLETGVGARALGMGGAFVAAVEDVTAIYWNPAGLVSLNTLQVHAMHSERFAGIVNWDFVGVGVPIKGRLALGFGFFRLGVDGIPFTRLPDPSQSLGRTNVPYAYKYVNSSEMAFVFGFAKRKSARFSYGGNVKVIRKSASEYGAWGLGFDFGVSLNPYRSMKVGLVLLDGTSTLVAWSGGRKELITPHLRAGVTYPIRMLQFKILPVLDVHIGFENRGSAAQVALGRVDLDFRGGLEVGFRDCVAIRVGTDRGCFTTGAGFRISAVGIDYGFSNHYDLGNTHRISITLFWDKECLLRFW